jgi:hypothetical protein
MKRRNEDKAIAWGLALAAAVGFYTLVWTLLEMRQ